MTVNEELVDRLSTEVGRRLSDKARAGRRRALARISRCCVTVTDDGRTTREVWFDQTPTLGQLVARLGPECYVVSIAMKRRPLRERIRLALAAE
ncbi:MAG: hypothetical protein H6897_08820 [Rhodobacteraceae bacterium]|jgi:hypothetical protein|uniref:hypothetical protein n=1 Tax=Albidovulum sp. TaxID=1872424 RepID=UPI001D8F2FD0|nr:hypothetical protein [Paracoccaceae bacterium]MCC0070016.1 hypothetical protein [Paracoccaceae bacterium]